MKLSEKEGKEEKDGERASSIAVLEGKGRTCRAQIDFCTVWIKGVRSKTCGAKGFLTGRLLPAGDFEMGRGGEGPDRHCGARWGSREVARRSGRR